MKIAKTLVFFLFEDANAGYVNVVILDVKKRKIENQVNVSSRMKFDSLLTTTLQLDELGTW